MTAPISSVSGLSSGIQWQDLVKQIIAAEAAREVDPLSSAKTRAGSNQVSLRTFAGVAGALQTAANGLSDPAMFSATTVSVPSSGSGILTATGSATAVPGRYDVETLQLARTDKVGGLVVTDAAAALGVTGSVLVNGRAVSITGSDTLQTLRDKVNTANTGANASGVSAVIQGGLGGARLVLTAGDTGRDGIELADGTAGALVALGLADGSTQGNVLPTGEMQSFRVSSSTAAVASLLGVQLPTPSTMRIGGQVINVDLSIDSLSAIVTRINVALGRPDAARIVSETANGRTQSRLVSSVPVEADGTVDAVASAATLAVLGFSKTGRGGVAQVVASGSAFTDGVSAATGSTLLTDLATSGGSLSLAVGDVLQLQGKRGDGSTVARTLTIGAGTTMQDVLTALNDGTSGFGAGARPATASVDGSGRLRLTDGVNGDSQLALAITVQRVGGGTSTLGAFGTANGTVGRSVAITAGQDATARVDGRLVSGRTNALANGVAGVTLNLQGLTTGTPVTLTVSRDTTGITQRVNQMVSAYNAMRTWVNTNTAPGGSLANDATVRGMMTTLTNSIIATIPGLSSGVSGVASLYGLQHDKAGVLSLDATRFAESLASQPTAVQQLFAMTGDASDAEVSFVTGSIATKPTSTPYAVVITQAATRASATGAVWSTYATSGAADTMSITDAATGRTASVSLGNGDGIDTVIARMNAAFAGQGLALTAAKTVGGSVQLTSAEYGSGAGFTIAYTPGAGGDGTAALGLAAGTTNGLNVAGSINGKVATGVGQALTAAKGDASEGLVIRYTGSTARAAGTVRFSQGVNGMIAKLTASMSSGAGSVTDARVAQLQARMDRLDRQILDQQKLLDNRRVSLTRQFIAMERAISKTNSISSAITAQLNSLNQQSR